MTVRPGAKERRDLLSPESLQYARAESMQDHEEKLTHPEFSTSPPIPQSLSSSLQGRPKWWSFFLSLLCFYLWLFLLSIFCFPSFPSFFSPSEPPPAPQLCLILYFSFRPVKHIISDPADWQPFEVVTLTARAGAQSQSVHWVMGQRWVQPPEEEHLDVTCTK